MVELLTQDGVRLLTLTGPGGTGKTRLALQAAAEASESFPDGVFWVPLAPLRDPELVLPSLARTLSVSEEPGKPFEDTLAAHLGEYALYENRVEEALPMLKEAYGINRDVGDPYEIVVTLFRLARAVALEGRGADAACLFSSSEALREKTDLSSPYWLADMNEGTLAMIHTQLDEVTFAAAWDEGRTLSADEAVALALGQPPSSARP